MTMSSTPPAIASAHADAAEIDDASVDASMRRRRDRQAAQAVGARQADRGDARGVERRDEARIDGAGQHRHRDVERRLVGDAQAVHLPLLDSRALQRRVDLFPAAMHDDDRPAARCDLCDGAYDGSQMPGILEQLPAKLENQRTNHKSAVRSSRPSITLRFWTACPDAPLSRLSSTDTMTARPDGSTRQPMSQKFVCATCLISGSAAPTSRTKVAPRYACS